MKKNTPFTIYNASAGSGKTFTLVKDYLKILLQSNNILAFRNILALTFTNKAVNEMKERIIETLQLFSDEKIIEQPNTMFQLISKELEINPEELHQKSKTVLHTIIHNYAAFDISTIDKFNHKLIRVFAHDLKLPINFEVELDTQNLLSKAVDKLIDKTGTDKSLTKVLVDFAIEKINDDKSWDIAYDFNAIAKLLINESEIPFIELIKDKSIEDFKLLKSQLREEQKTIETTVIKSAETILILIDECGLEHDDFSRKSLPNHFKNLANKRFNIKFDNNWQLGIETKALYPSKVSSEIASIIEDIKPQIIAAFYKTKEFVIRHRFLSNCLKNITPLSVLNAISKTLQELKEEDNLLLISEFNSIINKEIADQPAPYIYERIGEKFKHYFIDEFQDTSVLQWKNLIPLIDNTITGENLKGEIGSTMLVGDAKQAIYRWRGGDPEQFINLYNKTDNPFFIEQKVEPLPFNYRSFKTVVEFNNSFFKHISNIAFSNPQHRHIYENSSQTGFLNGEGYVELSFLNLKDEDKDQLYCENTLETIKKTIANGFNLNDICIITRKSKEGITIAQFLSENGIDIVSSESLMLKNSPEVQFITNIIKLAIQQKNNVIKIDVLNYIVKHCIKVNDEHAFYSKYISLDSYQLFESLYDYGVRFNFNTFLHMPLYEAAETIIRQFKLSQSSNAYIQFYLDEILDFSLKHTSSFIGFIEYWERKKDKLSIVSPQGKNAVQIMTIHKSKGLEFPVVIFPYANQNIYFDMSPKVWFPVEKEKYNGFSHLLINVNKDLETFNEKGTEIYNNYQSQLELDSINLLYVVLTRAVEQLYIISESEVDKNGNEKLKLFSGLFINYLKSINLWNENQTSYNFGLSKKMSKRKAILKQSIEQKQFISVSKEQHKLNIVTNLGRLWNTAQEKAIEKGNLVHDIMSHIKTIDDISFALDLFTNSGRINKQQAAELKSSINDIITHEKLHSYFNSNLTIYNEKDIISKKGEILRPDRVVINKNNKAAIIDYKTGLENSKHKEQLFDYQFLLEEMNFIVTNKILVYINNDITVKEF